MNYTEEKLKFFEVGHGWYPNIRFYRRSQQYKVNLSDEPKKVVIEKRFYSLYRWDLLKKLCLFQDYFLTFSLSLRLVYIFGICATYPT
jgi:hypothetical protein